MKTKTKQQKLFTKKQQEFIDFVRDRVFPFLIETRKQFDLIDPPLLADKWDGKNILVTIPYGLKMEPYFVRIINECYADKNKIITVICGAKVNTNVWHKFVFPFATEICFVRRGKRPTAIITYSNGCETKAFYSACDDTIAYTFNNIPTGISKSVIMNLINNEEEDEE